MATLLLRDEVHPDDLRATSADTSWELGVSELDHLTYLAPMAVLLGEWPGDINRCANPSFEDGLTGWAKQLEGGSTVEADATEGYDDGRSARMTRGTGICWLFEASTRSVGEGWQTVFLRVKGTPGARFVGRLHNYSGGAGSVYGPTLVLDGTWQVYTFSQYREAGSYWLILHLETDGATCNVDTVSIRYASPVVDPADSRWAQVDVAKADTLSLVAGQQGGQARKRILSTANGLLGEYFSIAGVPGPPPQYFGSLVFTRVDPVVDFNWGTSGPGNGLGADYFAVRWSGYVLTKAAGTYTFATITDDGTRVWVNGVLVIDKWQQQSPTRWTGSIDLPANALVPIVFEFYEWAGEATARLFWAPPGESEVIIPAENLFTGGVEGVALIGRYADYPPNLIPLNAGFSHNPPGYKGHPYGWELDIYGGDPVSSHEIVADAPPGVTFPLTQCMALKTSSSKTSVNSASRRFPVVGGKTYRQAGWIRGEVGAASPNLYLGRRWFDASGNAISYSYVAGAVKPSSWTYYEGTVVAPANAAQCEIWIINYSNTGSTGYFTGLVFAEDTGKPFNQLFLPSGYDPASETARAVTTEETESQVMVDFWSRAWTALRAAAEALAGSDARSVKPGKQATETQAVAEAWARVLSAFRSFPEISAPTDSRKVKATPRWSEATGLGDDRRAQVGKWTNEVEGLVEVLSRAWTAVRTFAEAHSPGDVRRTRFLTSFIESQSIGETWARTWAALLTVAQAVALVDVVRKLTRRTLAELQAAGEALANLWTAFLRPGEVLTPSDAERAKVGAPKFESVGLYDSRLAKPGLKVTDIQGLMESWSKAWQALRQLPDNLGAADALQKTGRPGFVEGVATLDTRTAKPGKKASDAIGLVEQLATVWTAFAGLYEALTSEDVRKAKATRPAQETLVAGDARTIRAIKTATDVVLPQVDLASLWQAYVEALESLWPSDTRWALARLRKSEATTLGASLGSVFSARRRLAEATGVVDDLAHWVGKIAGDLMQVLDELRSRIGARRSEDVTAGDSLASLLAKPLEDLTVLQVAQWSQAMVSLATDVGASDAFARAWSAFLAATESTEPGTSLRFATMLPRSENVAANAVQAFRATFTLAESTMLEVLLSWRAWLSWTFSETLMGLDVTRAWIASLRSEAQATVDGLAKSVARAFGDVLTVSGWFAAKVGLVWTISTAIVDGLGKLVALKKAEASAVADLRAMAVGQYLAATQDLKDACDHAAQFIRSLTDQAGLDVLPWWTAGLPLADTQTSDAGIASKGIGALRDESVRVWDWWTRRWRAVRSVGDLVVMSDVRAMLHRRLSRDAVGLADGMAKAIRKAIQAVQSIAEWFRQRFLGAYRRYNVRTLPWDATVQEQPWALAVYEVNSQPRVRTTAWPTEVRQIGWAQIREVGPRVLEMLVGEKRNVQLLVEAADGQPIQVDSQPPVVIEFLDGNQVKQDFGWVETGNKVFYAFAPENPGQYVLEFTISVDNGRQVLKHRVSVHVKS